MSFVEISSLPEMLFMHLYKADAYQIHFPVKENFLEISYIAEGSLELRVGDIDVCAKKGDVVCLFRNVETFLSAKDFHCHHTVGAALKWGFSNDKQGALFLPTVTPAERGTSDICRLIDDCIHNPILYKDSKVHGAAKFLELLCSIDKCNRRFQNLTLTGEILYIERAKGYIQRNIRKSITQKSIANYLGISSEYLCSIFKKHEDTTIMRYINKIKLENIKALVDNTNLHLYEAAAMYGYSDPNYVSRLYKQLYGYNITAKPQIHPTSK